MSCGRADGSTRVLVIGEALVDVIDGTPPIEHVGGSPANVALGLGRRGVPVSLLTQVGTDRRGRTIVSHLKRSGVRVLSPPTATHTSTAAARIRPDGQADYAFDVRWETFEVPAEIPELVHTGSIAAFLEPGAASVRAVFERAQGAEITFDPNIRPALLGPHAAAVDAFTATARLSTVVKLSDQDARWLYPGAATEEVVDALLSLGPRLVALTLGDAGAVLASHTARVRVDAERVDTIDTIGAGDTFMASLIHSALGSGSAGLGAAHLERIGTDAAHAAAITVSRPGADLPWAHELLQDGDGRR